MASTAALPLPTTSTRCPAFSSVVRANMRVDLVVFGEQDRQAVQRGRAGTCGGRRACRCRGQTVACAGQQHAQQRLAAHGLAKKVAYPLARKSPSMPRSVGAIRVIASAIGKAVLPQAPQQLSVGSFHRRVDQQGIASTGQLSPGHRDADRRRRHRRGWCGRWRPPRFRSSKRSRHGGRPGRDPGSAAARMPRGGELKDESDPSPSRIDTEIVPSMASTTALRWRGRVPRRHAPGRGAVGLLELLENAFHILLPQAGTRIGDGETDTVGDFGRVRATLPVPRRCR